MQVTFYDTNNNIVVDDDISGSGLGGTYTSVFLDPNPPPTEPWVIAPVTNAWTYLVPTNLNDTDPATETGHETPLEPITTTITAPSWHGIRSL